LELWQATIYGEKWLHLCGKLSFSMEKSAVIHKIKQMPDGLMSIVADFLDKLVQSYELGVQEAGGLSAEEKQEILNALAEYEAQPETGTEWDKLKASLSADYEL
jgi:hypothetical protein